jgi:acid-activated urea channel
MLGVSMLFVGAVLLLNGLMLLGIVDKKPVGVFNVLVATLCTLLALNNAFQAESIADYLATGNTLLFAFTYFLVAANVLCDLEGKALGWFSLYVAIATIPNFFVSFASGDMLMGVVWLAWGILWLLFYLSGALENKFAEKIVPYVAIFVGVILTGIPGYMMLFGVI